MEIGQTFRGHRRVANPPGRTRARLKLARVPNLFCRKASGLMLRSHLSTFCAYLAYCGRAAPPTQCRRLSESFKDLRLFVFGFRARLRPTAKLSVLSGGLRLRFRLDRAAELAELTCDSAHLHTCSLNSAQFRCQRVVSAIISHPR